MQAEPRTRPAITVDRDAAPGDAGPLVTLLFKLLRGDCGESEPQGSAGVEGEPAAGRGAKGGGRRGC